MFLLVSGRHVGAHPDGHQHGVSIQISINLGKMVLGISCIRKIALTWILARVFAYVTFFYSQILDLIYWALFYFYFNLFWITWHWKPAIEWRGILYPTYPILLQLPATHSLHSATILTHTIACSHISFWETKHCYSRNDVRSQLVPFFAFPRLWTWKCAKLQTLKVRTKLTKIATTTIFSQWWSGERGNLY